MPCLDNCLAAFSALGREAEPQRAGVTCAGASAGRRPGKAWVRIPHRRRCQHASCEGAAYPQGRCRPAQQMNRQWRLDLRRPDAKESFLATSDVQPSPIRSSVLKVVRTRTGAAQLPPMAALTELTVRPEPPARSALHPHVDHCFELSRCCPKHELLWLFAHAAMSRAMSFALPNVRVKPAPTVGRQARDAENVPRTGIPGLAARRWGSA